MPEREGVAEGGRFPGCGGVTSCAVRASLACMNILGRMAGNTGFGCSHEDTIDVTCGTGGIDVRSGQREGGQVVIEGGGLPGCGGMTGRAVRPILSTVMIIGCMTGKTCCGRAFELHVFMTTTTGNGCMLASQLEDGVGMVECAGLPGCGCMAGFTFGTQRATMRINVVMARSTGGGRADKEFILMALSAGYCSMFTRQLEIRILVIERGRRPAAGCVALRTLCAKFAGMRVIIIMTGGAIHRRAFELSIDMAALAGDGGMFAS